MLTMNPIDLYHDPGLDGLVDNPDKPRGSAVERRISAGKSRRPGNEEYNAKVNGRLPYAPDPPTGAPISYRGVGSDAGSDLQRSFSQRAKGKSLPYAEEAFDDDELDNMDIAPLPRQSSKPDRFQNHQQHVPQPDTSDLSGDENHPNGIQDVPQKTEKTSRPTTSQRQQASARASASQQIPQPRTPEPVATYHHSTTTRDSSNQTEEQRQDWASDRSPLQKLEVKLTDISKEEKRARVQEAEMRLMKDKNIPQTPDRTRRSNSENTRSNTHPAHTLSDRMGKERADFSRSNPSTARDGGRAQAEQAIVVDRGRYSADHGMRRIEAVTVDHIAFEAVCLPHS